MQNTGTGQWACYPHGKEGLIDTKGKQEQEKFKLERSFPLLYFLFKANKLSIFKRKASKTRGSIATKVP